MIQLKKEKRPETLEFEQVNSSEDSKASNDQNGSQISSQKLWTVKDCAGKNCLSFVALNKKN